MLHFTCVNVLTFAHRYLGRLAQKTFKKLRVVTTFFPKCWKPYHRFFTKNDAGVVERFGNACPKNGTSNPDVGPKLVGTHRIAWVEVLTC